MDGHKTYYCLFSGYKCNYIPAKGIKCMKKSTSIKKNIEAMLKASKKISNEPVMISVSYHTNHTRASSYIMEQDYHL